MKALKELQVGLHTANLAVINTAIKKTETRSRWTWNAYQEYMHLLLFMQAYAMNSRLEQRMNKELKRMALLAKKHKLLQAQD